MTMFSKEGISLSKFLEKSFMVRHLYFYTTFSYVKATTAAIASYTASTVTQFIAIIHQSNDRYPCNSVIRK